MSGHLSADDLELYRRAETPDELLAFDDHVALCADCRSRVASVARAGESVSSLRAELRDAAAMDDDHLAYDDLAAYTDGELAEVERETVESHLAVCRECDEEVRDLLAFRNAASADFATPYTSAAVSHRRPDTPGVRQRFLAFLAPSTTGVSFWRAGLAASAVLLVALAIGWLVWGSRSAGPEIAHTPAASPTVTPNVESTPSPSPADNLPELVVALNDGGGRVTLDANGNLEGAGALTVAQAEAIKTALRSQAVVSGAALEGLGQRGALRGGPPSGDDFTLRSPVGTVVEGARPSLRWDALGGATAYRVTVYDSNFNAVASSGDLKTTSWTVPEALTRGRIYSWQVTALKDEREFKSPRPPAPEARFRVLDAARANELQRLRSSRPHSRLALGVLCARAGLLDEAEREFAALVQANPQSEVARKLLSEVRSAKKR